MVAMLDRRGRAGTSRLRIMLRDIGERRSGTRHTIGRIGKIQYGSGTLPRDCLITDISDGGVRLHAEGLDVPAQFTLWFAGGNAGRRECSVVWRLGHEIGAEFIDAAPEGFARRVASGPAPQRHRAGG
jgi:PilZ domain-containing protein